jgi:hypothetical protein
MPFHPTCFEVFTRVSRLRLGSIDVDGLLTWRHKSPVAENRYLNLHPALRRGSGQWWQHVPGDEYLAANPVLVPALPAIFRNAAEMDPLFDIQASAFERTAQDGSLTAHTHAQADPFDIFPHELITILLSYLPPRDIATLRLTSRAFLHLPISFFRDLLRREMPFLWEIREATPPSLWAIHTAASMQECAIRPARLAAQLGREQEWYKKVIQEEMPDVWETYRGDQPWLNKNPVLLEEETKAEMLRRYRESVPLVQFDPERMNWYKLYCGIVRGWDELKGLQNRKRIWEALEGIVEEVRVYRETGQIEP